MRRTIWKLIDSNLNPIGLWIDRKKQHTRWLTFSWFRGLFGITAVRADYVQFTAKLYAENCRKHAREFQIPPEQTTEEYFRNQLIAAGMQE